MVLAGWPRKRAAVVAVAIVAAAAAAAAARARGPKAFFLGFNKTGTRTGVIVMGQLLGRHRSHHGILWPRESTMHNATFFEDADFYADGSQADFEWLDQTFPGSAFAINTRPLDEWLVSRFAHNARHWRTGGFRSKDNSPCAVLGSIKSRERYHAKVTAYFSSGKASGSLISPMLVSSEDTATVARQYLSMARAVLGQSATLPTVAAVEKVMGHTSVHNVDRDHSSGIRHAKGAEVVAEVFKVLGLSEKEGRSLLTIGREVPGFKQTCKELGLASRDEEGGAQYYNEEGRWVPYPPRRSQHGS